jgi:hypothetical protein
MSPVDRAPGPRYPCPPVPFADRNLFCQDPQVVSGWGFAPARLQPKDEALERSPVTPPELRTRSGVGLFRAALRERPVGAAAGLVVEYLTFASAVFLAITLYLTRHPMGFLDRVLGLRLRERFVDFIARISPG